MSEFSDEESSRLTARTNRPPIESNTIIQPNGEAKFGRLDREKTTPMYLRMYCRMGGHHTLEEFERNTVPNDDELTIYTWKDATLKELAGLIKEVNEESRRRDVKFGFRSYYQEISTGRWRAKELGMVYNSRATRDDSIQLNDKGFRQGDLIDVAIYFAPAGIAPPPEN